MTVALFAAVAGCSDEDNGNTDDPGGVVGISMIILNPKSAEPGDTVIATAVLEGYAAPGDFPAISWSSDGGTFLTNNQTSVGWVAPTTSGVYRLTCKVTGGSNSDQLKTDVFVGNPALSVNGYAGEIHLLSAPPDYYYLHSVPIEGAWDSSSVYIKSSGAPGPVVVSTLRVGAEFAFSNALMYSACVVNDSTNSSFTEDALNIYLTNLAAGTQQRVTTDKSFADGTRRQQYRYPYFSPDQNWVTYQGFLPHPQSGTVDTLDVFVYNIQTEEETNVTSGDVTSERRRNTYPTYSTDFAWLVYVSDRASRDQWDLYGQKVTNGVVDTDPQNVVRLTTGGLIGHGPGENLGVPDMAWNPTQPIVAVVGASGSDGALHLVQTNASGASTEDVTEAGTSVIEFAWSSNGGVLAISSLINSVEAGGTVNAIFTSTPSGVATKKYEAIMGDRIIDMVWAPDSRFLVYRVVRGSLSWFELFDVDGGTVWTGPVVITSTVGIGSRNAYAAEMSTAARYSAQNVVYYIQFDDTLVPSASPSIWTLDISGAVTP
jgi:Tol biopolymer transport system component